MVQLLDITTAITSAFQHGVENAMAQTVEDAGLPPVVWMVSLDQSIPGRIELIGELDICLTPAEVHEAVTAYADAFGAPVMTAAGHLVTTTEFTAGPDVLAVTVTGLVDEDAYDRWTRRRTGDRPMSGQLAHSGGRTGGRK